MISSFLPDFDLPTAPSPSSRVPPAWSLSRRVTTTTTTMASMLLMLLLLPPFGRANVDPD